MVYESYLKVMAKEGSAGIDKQTIDQFNANLPGNLYKIWNRLTSGSYFPPPVRTVFIPKKQGGVRPLGIPTVSDRIAQGVVKAYLEPSMEAIFHGSSFGYRPGKSAHDALAQCQANCLRYKWVVDVDIKGFFDNLSHTLLMGLLEQHTQEKWVLLYVERWLKAGVEQEDGSIAARQKGTPQGGVISPLLANLYLHHAFDRWIETVYPQCPFERYADDIVIHCSSKAAAEQLLEKLSVRMRVFALTLHPEKTKLVYCRNYLRKGSHEQESFTFLSYSFQPRTVKSKVDKSKRLLIFGAAISTAAKKSIRTAIRSVLNPQHAMQTLASTASKLNPKLRGWINYYTKYGRREGYKVFTYLNDLLGKWIKNKYEIQSKGKLYRKYQEIQSENPLLFYHWELGIKA